MSMRVTADLKYPICIIHKVSRSWGVSLEASPLSSDVTLECQAFHSSVMTVLNDAAPRKCMQYE